VAVGLGVASGAASLYGGTLWQHRVEANTQEAAWAAAISPGPPAGDWLAGEEGGILALLAPRRRLFPYSPSYDRLLRMLLRWTDDREPRERVFYVDGAPWSGKTRLLVEAAAEMPIRCGWARPGRQLRRSRRQSR
jgi:hypothetical protein